MLVKMDDFSDNEVQLYREYLECEQPFTEFAFSESVYLEGKQLWEQSSEQMGCHCPVLFVLDSKLIAVQLRPAI